MDGWEGGYVCGRMDGWINQWEDVDGKIDGRWKRDGWVVG